MPSFEIVKTSEIDDSSFRVNAVKNTFDIQQDKIQEVFKGEIPIDSIKWKIGVIHGASGTGKSTIARELFGNNYFVNQTYESQSIIDDMPKGATVEQITKTFVNVGFGSTPSWLKPYPVLSNGEKMRVDLSRALLGDKDLIVFDEFTSVVDRNIAKIGSLCVQKVIRRGEKKFVAVTCHDDIIDWLQPDWTFCTNTMEFNSSIKKKDQSSGLRSTRSTEVHGGCLLDITI